MKLEEFKDLIFIADYKVYESKIKKNPTWYSFTLDVFFKFLYKVIIPFLYAYVYFFFFVLDRVIQRSGYYSKVVL